MNKTLQLNVVNLWSNNREIQNKAFFFILKETEKSVDWAYEIWGEVVINLSDKDNHNRAIAAQVLCNLAKSDPEKRILKNLKDLLLVTKDERFVTARHCMQALWKVGIAGKEQQATLTTGLERRYKECISEKNCTLIRFDIIQCLRNIYESRRDEKIKDKALELIEMEEAIKYRKKYSSLWKKG